MILGDKKDNIKLTVPSKTEYLSLIRLTASSVAANMGFNIDDIDDIKVSVGEACTSIIENLNPREDNNFKIRYSVKGNKFKIRIKIKKVTEEDSINLSELMEDGLSMMIIQSLMDEIEVTSNSEVGSEIKMIKVKRDE